LITVSQALKAVLMQLGVPEHKIRVLRNGVDLELFRPPKDRHAMRSLHGIHKVTLLSVGQLVPLKGHDSVIRAMADLPDFDLLIAGDGPDKSRLRGIIDALALGGRVRFLGRVDHEKLSEFYGAADITVLASTREGWANVLLESMACGTPVVATRVGGTPEVITAPEAGLLTNDGKPKTLACAIKKLLANCPDRVATRRYAERFSWDETSAGQLNLFRDVLWQRT
jgi:glycosyltransferase involved in cell wall biosynthesis